MPSWRHLPHPYVIFADDLTGANDAGVQFARAGLRTRVGLGQDYDKLLDGAEIMVIDTDSRSLSPAEAYKVVLKAARAFAQMRVPVLYKKIDSTLRGAIGTELDAVMDAYDLTLSIVCPAFPANRRTIVHGVLLIDGVPVAQTSFGADPTAPVRQSHLPTLLQTQTRRAVHLITLDDVAAGAESLAQQFAELRTEEGLAVVCDALTDEHLALIAAAAMSLGDTVVLAGSAGLACPLAERIGERGGATHGERVLIVCGSMHPIVREQVAALVHEMDAYVVTPDPGWAFGDGGLQQWLDAVLRRITTVPAGAPIVLTGPPDVLPSGRDGRLLAHLAEVANSVMESISVSGVVATGGSTVRALCERWEVAGIDLRHEVAPGIPLGNVRGGLYDGLPLVTKAGGFGDSSTLVKIVRYLEGAPVQGNVA